MNHNPQNFPFYSCLVRPDGYFALRTLKSLENNSAITCTLFDLKQFDSELNKLGGEKTIFCYLHGKEQDYLKRLTSDKRKREWLGGRFAARYAATQLLSRSGKELDWTRLSIEYDNDGRPFLAFQDKNITLPDISISHSADMAAAMAINTGLCGIDIQKITGRIAKVRERFCSDREEKTILSAFCESTGQHIIGLTGLWAAKEALRKVAKDSIVPGFLEFELKVINENYVSGENSAWKFSINRKPRSNDTTEPVKKHKVAVYLSTVYVLALATTGDTVSYS
jgi:phosphopantetheinyl transferase